MLFDFIFEDHGTISLVRPRNDDLRAQLADRVGDEALWHGDALVVEHRYTSELLDGLEQEGFNCTYDPEPVR